MRVPQSSGRGRARQTVSRAARPAACGDTVRSDLVTPGCGCRGRLATYAPAVSFTTLAVIGLVGILGPLPSLPRHWHVPVVLGELLGGVALGRTGIGYLHADDPTLTLLAAVGFALVMFVAGTHVPIRQCGMRPALRIGTVRGLVVGAVATGHGWGLSSVFGTGHAAMYAVLMASSSAALILPIVTSLGLEGEPGLQLLPQIAIADAACVVTLPLAVEPEHALRAAAGPLPSSSSLQSRTQSCTSSSSAARASGCTRCPRDGCSRWNSGSSW